MLPHVPEQHRPMFFARNLPIVELPPVASLPHTLPQPKMGNASDFSHFHLDFHTRCQLIL
jgi:hypothetical protein